MIKVCDAIMGSGKSQSAIAWMNEHANEKFIYITPYLDEATRIKNGCPSLRFTEPSNKIPKHHFLKSEHTAELIRQGRNITTTHQAFQNYTEQMLKDIRDRGYTLIIDESVESLQSFDFDTNDLKLLIKAGYVKEENGMYSLTDEEYRGSALKPLLHLLKSRNLTSTPVASDLGLFWTLPPELITSFRNVFILTYLFEGQSLHHLLEMYKIPYKYIGVKNIDGTRNGFRFSDTVKYVPDYVSRLGDMIHIIEGKLNNIGEDKCALSMNWFNRVGEDEITQLKNNIYNCFNNIWKGVLPNQRLWATYNERRGRLRGKGYTKAFLNFSARATNEYRDRTHLAYIANVFINARHKLFYHRHGVKVDDDLYALSMMVQWIWRSAIRDGHEIYIYIPSSRMRGLLKNWILNISKGGDAFEQKTV